MGELSRNRSLQPRKLTNNNVVRFKMSVARVNPSNTLSLQCFQAQGTTNDHWKPSPFSCLVAETLIALFASGNASPAEAEKRMQDWCARPVRVSNMQYPLTLKMTTAAQVVKTSVTVNNNNSPIQDYVHPDDQTQPTFEMTPGFKPFSFMQYLVYISYS